MWTLADTYAAVATMAGVAASYLYDRIRSAIGPIEYPHMKFEEWKEARSFPVSARRLPVMALMSASGALMFGLLMRLADDPYNAALAGFSFGFVTYGMVIGGLKFILDAWPGEELDTSEKSEPSPPPGSAGS